MQNENQNIALMNQQQISIQHNQNGKEALKQIGRIKVKKNCPKNICNQLQKLRTHFSKDTKNYHLSSQNWQKTNLPELSKYIIEWDCPNILQLYANNYSLLYKEIENINFPTLKYLNTWGNNIQSIQLICRIHFPNLEQICLWNNRITRISPFRRISAPNLTWLDLKQNYIIDHQSLSQYHNASKKLKRLHLSSQSYNFVVVKMEANIYNDVCLMFKNQLINPKLIYMMKKMYLDAKDDQDNQDAKDDQDNQDNQQ